MSEKRNLLKRNLLSGAGRWAPYPLIFLPAALAFLYVHSFGVSVPWGDSWPIVTLFEEWFKGTLDIADLWAIQNGHRPFFPRIAMLGLGVLTSYNSVAEMYLTLGCFLLTLIGLLLVFRSNVGASSWSLLLFVPIAFVAFSLRQHDNMLEGFQLQFGMVQAFSVLALCSLYFSGYGRLRKFAFPAALASATVASFSGAQGLLAWPAGLAQLLIAPIEKPAKRWLVGAWGSVGVAEWTVYLIGYTDTGQSSMGYLLAHPAVGMEYFLVLLGSSLFWQQATAFFGGLLLVGLAGAGLVLVYRNGRLGEHSFWVALLFFSLLTLASITLGRAGGEDATNSEVNAALRSRYTSFSIPVVISTYAMFVKSMLESRRSYLAAGSLGVLSVLILLSVPRHYSEGIERGKDIQAGREKPAFILSTYESQPDEALKEVHKNPNRVKRQGRMLEKHGYSVFSEPRPRVLPSPPSKLSPVSSNTPSEVESIAGVRVDQEDQPVVVSTDESFIAITGWAVDAEAEDAAGGIYLDIDGNLFPAYYGAGRKDLVDRFGVPSYRYAGFERAIPVSEIGTGTHELSVVVLTNDEEGYYRPAREIALEIR